ncbi:MAG: hypothetical protein RQ824_02280 [bacterium]|nr:hypothetical protein [bacterium]
MRLLLVLIMLSTSFGCISSHGKRFSALVPEVYVSEIKRLNDIVESGPKQGVRIADVHLQLALLHSSYKNPNRDYDMALIEIEKYVALEPKGANDYEIQNLLTLLKTIKRGRNKGRESALLSKNKELVLKVGELTEEIKGLNETIDKLKQLDVELEKKRKSFK